MTRVIDAIGWPLASALGEGSIAVAFVHQLLHQ
jgi:hypothetical protein